jgi:hypothetical protein
VEGNVHDFRRQAPPPQPLRQHDGVATVAVRPEKLGKDERHSHRAVARPAHRAAPTARTRSANTV